MATVDVFWHHLTMISMISIFLFKEKVKLLHWQQLSGK